MFIPTPPKKFVWVIRETTKVANLRGLVAMFDGANVPDDVDVQILAVSHDRGVSLPQESSDASTGDPMPDLVLSHETCPEEGFIAVV